MKILYYLSYVPTAPFYALAWMLYGMAWALQWIGDTIHDLTTYRAWLVLHRRACSSNNRIRANGKE